MIKHSYIIGGWKEDNLVFCLVTSYTRYDATELFRKEMNISPYTIAFYKQAHKDACIGVEPILEEDATRYPIIGEIRAKLLNRKPN